MSFAVRRRSEKFVGPVQPIEKAEQAVALVKLEVVEIVEFGRYEAGQVIAAVIVQRTECCAAVPKPCDDKMRSHHSWSLQVWKMVDNKYNFSQMLSSAESYQNYR